MIPDERFREVFNRLEETIERRYGIPITVRDVPEPFTGDLDGAVIDLDYDLPAGEALFILLHLFGHTVQWNVSPEMRELGLLPVTDPTDELLARVEAYELEAARYSIRLLHELGIHDLDQWLSDFTRADVAYLLHFYRTGEKLPLERVWREGGPRVEELPIPPFHPTRWVSRASGGVVV
ncbi:MAG TPA: hypothetical protein VFX98_05380 [Longimicrobiaceae bacterium]|nr:hypothetical protein [Longimicrobiaceae bacterium]